VLGAVALLLEVPVVAVPVRVPVVVEDISRESNEELVEDVSELVVKRETRLEVAV